MDDSTEQLLYDYSLNEGDTLHINTQLGAYKCLVYNVDSVLYDSIYYKIQDFQPFDSNGACGMTFSVVQGIGEVSHDIFYPLYPRAIEKSCHLCAFHNNGFVLDLNLIFYLGDCTLSITDNNPNKLAPTIYPNPITHHTIINWNTAIKNGQLTIYSSMGQKVYSTTISNQKQMPLPYYELLPGQYFYKVLDMDKGVTGSGRFEK